MTQLLEAVAEAGVAGAGGAGFPTARKLDCRGRVDTLIINGAECEPLLHSDFHCLLHTGDRVLEGAQAIRAALGIGFLAVAVKRKRSARLAGFARAVESLPGARVLWLEDVYPSGDEHVLAFLATGRVPPQGGIPLSVGVLVHNVQTVAHVRDALRGIPVTHRFCTVGGCVARPFVAEVPVGTPAEDLIDAAGGCTVPDPRFLEGGVMMGKLREFPFSVSKTTSGVLVLPAGHPAVAEQDTRLGREADVSASVCDQCFACTETCPRHLLGHDIQPHLIMRRARAVLRDGAEPPETARFCCECGVCSLVACPLRITPRRLIAAIRKGLKKGVPVWPQAQGGAHPDFLRKATPVGALKMRLALTKLDVEPAFLGPFPDPPRLDIPLRGFGGSAATPAVRSGQTVWKGECVARGPGGNVHSPMRGVAEFGDDRVCVHRGD